MWKAININKQNIQAETLKAYLIKMPHRSQYDGYSFWHPSKLVREGRHSNALSISYTDQFNFKLIKYGKNNNKIDEVEIDATEFEEAFEVMNNNIIAPTFKSDYETHKPEELNVEHIDVLDELKDE